MKVGDKVKVINVRGEKFTGHREWIGCTGTIQAVLDDGYHLCFGNSCNWLFYKDELETLAAPPAEKEV